MPLWIHSVVVSEGLRSYVWYPKRCRTQWTVHLHAEGCCQSKVLWEFCALRTFLRAGRWLWQCCSGWMEMSDEDHLWIEVTTYQVVDSFQGKDVHGTHLPWVGWSWHRSEGCCSILGLETGAGLTLLNCFFYDSVYAWPEDTSTCKQLGIGGSLMKLAELL